MKFRSVLFVPGHEEKKIKKAFGLQSEQGSILKKKMLALLYVVMESV